MAKRRCWRKHVISTNFLWRVSLALSTTSCRRWPYLSSHDLDRIKQPEIHYRPSLQPSRKYRLCNNCCLPSNYTNNAREEDHEEDHASKLDRLEGVCSTGWHKNRTATGNRTAGTAFFQTLKQELEPPEPKPETEPYLFCSCSTKIGKKEPLAPILRRTVRTENRNRWNHSMRKP